MDVTDAVAKGKAFHRDLFRALGHPLHAEDETHDLMVGATLLTAIGEGDPARAAQQYNEWAQDHGYAPILWLGTFVTPDGRRHEWVDIRDAVICISSDYSLRVLEGSCRSGQA